MTEPIDLLNKFTLRIHDPAIESAYKQYRYEKVYQLSKLTFGVFLIIEMFVMGYRQYDESQRIERFMYVGGTLLFMNIMAITILCIARKRPSVVPFFGPTLWIIFLIMSASCHADNDPESEHTCDALLIDAKYDLLVTLIFFQTHWFFDWLFYLGSTYAVLGWTQNLTASFLLYRAIPLSLYVSYILERSWKLQFLENCSHQKSTQFYQMMLDLTKDGVIITDKLSERTLFYNKEAQKLIGLKRQLHYQISPAEAYDYESNEWLQEQLFNKEVFMNEASTKDSKNDNQKEKDNQSSDQIESVSNLDEANGDAYQSLGAILHKDSEGKGINYIVKKEDQIQVEMIQQAIDEEGNVQPVDSDRNNLIEQKDKEKVEPEDVAIRMDEIEVVNSESSSSSPKDLTATARNSQPKDQASSTLIDCIVQVEQQNLQDRFQVVYLRNVTQIMENNVIKQLSRTQEMLQATVSHELRAPLSNITLVSQLLIKGLGDCRTKADMERLKYYKQIEDQSTFLLFLVNDLLDISQIKNGIFNLNPIEFKVSKFLRQTLDMFDLQAQQHKTKIQFKLYPSVPQYIFGEKTRLQQVIINLVKNALKFTREGSITVEVEYDSEAELLKVHVRDTGKGIKAEDQSKLFKMFGKLQRTADINNEGVGLGLTISKMLVEKLGGEISVYSAGIDQGSTFSFSMRFGRIKVDGRPKELMSNRNLIKSFSSRSNHQYLDASMDIITLDQDPEQSFIGNLMKTGKQQQQQQQRQHKVKQGFKPTKSQFAVNDSDPYEIESSYKSDQFKDQQISNNKTVQNQQKISFELSSNAKITESESVSAMSSYDHKEEVVVVESSNIDQQVAVQEPVKFKDILAIDDSIFNLEALQMILNACWQLDCDFQTDGWEAVEHLEKTIQQNHLYKLILIDYSMPSLDGPSTAKEIIKLFEKYQKPLPVLVCFSAYQQDSFKNIALEAGMHHYLVKPPKSKDLLSILQKSELI